MISGIDKSFDEHSPNGVVTIFWGFKNGQVPVAKKPYQNLRETWKCIEHAYMFVCVCVCTCVCKYICIYVCTYVCMHICMYVCMYVCIYICMWVYTYIYN